MNYEHECNYMETMSEVSIECQNCIEKFRYATTSGGRLTYFTDCICEDIIITKSTCIQCEKIQNRINTLKCEIDNLLFSLSYEIKQYCDCDDDINHIHDISKELRTLNRILLVKESQCKGDVANKSA